MIIKLIGAVMAVIVLDLQLPMQSVLITTEIVNSNPAQTRYIPYIM
jgi:CheY-like chemotaxis protein